MSKELQRMFLAGALIALILLGAQLLFPPSNEDITEATEESNPRLPVPDDVNPKIKEEVSEKLKNHASANKETVSTNKFTAIINHSAGGSLIDFKLTEKNEKNEFLYAGTYIQHEEGLHWTYDERSPVQLIQDNKACAPCVQYLLSGGKKSLNAESWELRPSTQSDDKSIIFEYLFAIDGKEMLKKTVKINMDNFKIKHEITKIDNNISEVSLVWDAGILPAEKNLSDEKSGTYTFASIGLDNDYEYTSNNGSSGQEFRPNVEDDEMGGTFPAADWVSIRNKYFTMAMIPYATPSHYLPADGGYIKSNGSADFVVKHGDDTINETAPLLGAGLRSNSAELNVELYFGPLDVDYISDLSYVDQTMSFGPWGISFIARWVLSFAKFLHGFGLPYGLVLILMAFIVRIVTGPLAKKSHESTQKMQTIQPEMKKLQEKHKDDSQKLNQEMIKLYQKRGVNPVGGCLPMIIQMPLLFALFMVFRATIELRGESFLFGLIKNLSAPDYFIEYPFFLQWWPINYIYGSGIAFLPLLLGVTMFMSQKLNAKAMDPKQKPMMYMMTGFFFLIFNNFPSGLNLYYLIYNILNYLQQRSIKKAT